MRVSIPTIRFRITRAVRRLFRIDRERRWNAEYVAGDWSRLARLDELAHHAVLAGYLRNLKPGGSVLDVGCGEGLLRTQLGDACGLYLGIDFAEPIRLASAHATERTRFAIADMHDFTTIERFDAIIFDESLYYYKNQVAGLQRYTTMLAPQGVLLVSMHRTARTAVVWAQIAEQFDSLDDVEVTNRSGVAWTVKALIPRSV